MYAVIASGGKQYKVKKGDKLKIAKLPGKEGKVLKFKQVLLSSDKKIKIGQPKVSGAEVTAKILRHGKTRKIRVFKYHNKNRYRRTYGHRQDFTEVEITGIKG